MGQQGPLILAAQEHDDSYKPATIGVMAGTAAVIIAWDVYIATKHGNTESQLLSGGAWSASTLPFSAGVIVGHWFFNRAEPNYKLWPVGLAILGAVATWDLLRKDHPGSWTRYPGLWFALGVPVGMITWGQKGNF